MSDTRFTLRSAVYLILLKEDKILLSRRFNTGWMDGKYSLIAGHLEQGESVSQAMIREAAEEAKIIIASEDLIPATVIHRKSLDQQYIDFFFVVRRWSGEPIIGEPEKCDDLSWFPMNKLPDNLLFYIKEAIYNYENKVAFFECGWGI